MDTLKQFGCEQIFEEKISGASKERPQLMKLFSILPKGDSVIV
ncbi:recombinase family protein [Pedobacter quisquiliarum]